MADGPREDPRSSAGVRVPDMGAFAGHVSRVLTSRTNYESCVADGRGLDSRLDSLRMCTHCLFTCAEVPLIPSASHEIAPRSLSRSPHTHPGPLAARHATRSSSSALAVSLSLSRLRSRACPHTLSRARCSLLALVGSRRLSLSPSRALRSRASLERASPPAPPSLRRLALSCIPRASGSGSPSLALALSCMFGALCRVRRRSSSSALACGF